MVGHSQAEGWEGAGGTGRGRVADYCSDQSLIWVDLWFTNERRTEQECEMKMKRNLFHRGAGGRESVISLQKQVSTVSHFFHHSSTRESTWSRASSVCLSFKFVWPPRCIQKRPFSPHPQTATPPSRMAAPQPAQLAVSRFTFTQVSGNGQQRDNEYQREESSKQRKRKEKGVKVTDMEGWRREKQRGPVVLNVFAFIPEFSSAMHTHWPPSRLHTYGTMH